MGKWFFGRSIELPEQLNIVGVNFRPMVILVQVSSHNRNDNPTIVAFGGDAHVILNRNFKNEFRIFKIPHYSNYTGKEKYREEVKSILGFI